ncbi:M14 family metallopeptidase [Alteribacter populi]|uniref:M14 family metallopeptidase n=1 Tax=Alteribacter populi TaxID=2011011 RepID=UPI000BBABB41|nr:M14 family metallopeptidase [Alteribacter populi]
MYYQVKQGDTLRRVAAEHNIRVSDILELNRELDEYAYIYPGMLLNTPSEKVVGTREATIGTCCEEFNNFDVKKCVESLGNMPDVSTEIIGSSVLGKPLYSVSIGTGKKHLFYSGAWHGNEWLTSKFLCDWCEQLMETKEKGGWLFGYPVRDILKEVTVHIVPMVNPDGVELVQQGIYPKHPHYKEVLAINRGGLQFDHWSANIRGVDLNHQWPAGWQKEADESPQEPWPRHYSGRNPLTEPEAIAIYDWSLKHDFEYVLAFHSQGQMIFWGYNGLEPEISKDMVHRLSLKSSYVPIHTADSDAGYKDWFIQKTGRPGFTIEVGVGVNPLPLRAYSEIWANNLLLALEGLTLTKLMKK